MPNAEKDAPHNHVTRDIKPRGQCPGCDRYHDRHSAENDPTYEARAAAKRLMDQAFHTAGDAEGRARVLEDWETILDALQRVLPPGVTE